MCRCSPLQGCSPGATVPQGIHTTSFHAKGTFSLHSTLLEGHPVLRFWSRFYAHDRRDGVRRANTEGCNLLVYLER